MAGYKYQVKDVQKNNIFFGVKIDENLKIIDCLCQKIIYKQYYMRNDFNFEYLKNKWR